MLSVDIAQYPVLDYRLPEKGREVFLDSPSYSAYGGEDYNPPFRFELFMPAPQRQGHWIRSVLPTYLEMPEEVSSQCFSARDIGSKIARYETWKRISRSPTPFPPHERQRPRYPC